jgi:uncharacterized protein YkwD
MVRTMAMASLGLAVAVVVLAAPVTPAAPVAPAAAAGVDDEAAFLAAINGLRASKGLPPLATHPELTALARHWAGRMAAAGDISHNPALASSVSAPWTKLGENVGVGPDVASVFTAFVNSPAHYRNLVDAGYTHVGVGVVRAGDRLFTAHEFMTLAGAAVPAPPPLPPPSPAPAPAPASPPAPPAPPPSPPPVAPPPPRPAPPLPAPAAEAAPPAPPPPARAPAPLLPAMLAGLRMLDRAA